MKKNFIILLFVLGIGAYLRLYKIDQYMTFLGDEGRDAIVVRRLLVNFDPILIGPGTSIGNMYLGPLYYYMMAPALLLSGLSPVGPAIMIALLGILTIFLVWYIAREWYGGLAAWIASILYAVSPTVIVHSRSSWNPNIMPFFALLCMYSVWRVWRRQEYKWLVILGISYAFVLQSHYLGLLLAPTLGVFWLLTLIRSIRVIRSIRNLIRYSLISLVLFSILMSPLVIFDARHGWRNFDAMKKFFTERQTTVSARPWNALPKIYPIFEKINTRLLTAGNEKAGKPTSLVIVALLGLLILFKKNHKSYILNPKSFWLLSSWLGFALIGLGLYKQEIYDHYYGFFFPAPFILLGGIASQISNLESKIPKILIFGFLILLIVVNLQNSPLLYLPNRQLQRTEEVARKISTEAKDQRFNLAVIAERNYEDAYQYFLEWWRRPVVDIDPLRASDTITGQLFVVCEFPAEKCDPTHNPKAEVANFGWSKVDGEWQVAGVTLYKLIHTK